MRVSVRRFAPVILVAGAATVGSFLFPHLPHERQLELRLEHPRELIGVELSIADPNSAKGDDLGIVLGSSWRFSQGEAPSALTLHVNLPDGHYKLYFKVEREHDQRRIERTLTLDDADRITIPIP